MVRVLGFDFEHRLTQLRTFRAILHDESVFPDPFRFDPTRYLRSEDGKPTFAETRVMGAAFGFGRR